VSILICICRPILGLMVLTSAVTKIIPLPELSWNNFFKALIVRAQYNFFLSNRPGLNSTEFEALDLSPMNSSIGTVFAVVLYFHNLGSGYAGILTLIGVCVLWTATNDFCTIWNTNLSSKLSSQTTLHQPESTADIPDVELRVLTKRSGHKEQSNFAAFMKDYVSLKQLAAGINEAFGELYLCYPIALCFYYATEINALFKAVGWINKLYFSYLLTQTALMLILSGDICRKV